MTKAELKKELNEVEAELEEVKGANRELRQQRAIMLGEKKDERRTHLDEGYVSGYQDAKRRAIDLISESIQLAKDARNQCTMEGNEVGINNINSGILSFSTIKIKLMEEL